jgi:hypothetical protein
MGVGSKLQWIKWSSGIRTVESISGLESGLTFDKWLSCLRQNLARIEQVRDRASR